MYISPNYNVCPYIDTPITYSSIIHYVIIACCLTSSLLIWTLFPLRAQLAAVDLHAFLDKVTLAHLSVSGVMVMI